MKTCSNPLSQSLWNLTLWNNIFECVLTWYSASWTKVWLYDGQMQQPALWSNETPDEDDKSPWEGVWMDRSVVSTLQEDTQVLWTRGSFDFDFNLGS
jgi:hypothetical protein